ncbi:porin [Cesiribacter sp. SM1]|uniref:porin n=1 Tax=Cesiribacter sp. SM1 TaxID=2861196 RepID=UPI001CD4B9E0|nr:porin [Cesiribacter sp. SM1]
MRREKEILVLLIGLLLVTSVLSAQDRTSNEFGKGIKVIAQDSSFYLRFGTRFQTLYSGVYDRGSYEYNDRLLVRRARLKFDGFAYSPKLKYKLELGLTNRDIGGTPMPEANNTANIILDAVLKYSFYNNWSIWFGQTKLPGNIERVISSSSLQFVDRSNLNSAYNLDRDVGLQLHYSAPRFRFISSISKGEGRNITANNAGGYDYTQRIEWLPFGSFTKKGDYYGADLNREKDLKLLLGATYDYNDGASRESGQLGKFLREQGDLKTWFVDAHAKYNGFSTIIEYANKQVIRTPVVTGDGDVPAEPFMVGTGLNAQAGYLFHNNLEIAVRYTDVNPEKETQANRNKEYTIGISKYIVGHSLKIQSDVSLVEEGVLPEQYVYRFQVEFSL